MSMSVFYTIFINLYFTF